MGSAVRTGNTVIWIRDLTSKFPMDGIVVETGCPPLNCDGIVPRIAGTEVGYAKPFDLAVRKIALHPVRRIAEVFNCDLEIRVWAALVAAGRTEREEDGRCEKNFVKVHSC